MLLNQIFFFSTELTCEVFNETEYFRNEFGMFYTSELCTYLSKYANRIGSSRFVGCYFLVFPLMNVNVFCHKLLIRNYFFLIFKIGK